MDSKKIILAISIFFLVSIFSLSWFEKNQASYDAGKNWWLIYFDDPKSGSLDFTIENHSDSGNFHWSVLKDNVKIKEGDIAITKGQSNKMNLTPSDIGENLAGKISILVESGDNRKEIYKIFSPL